MASATSGGRYGRDRMDFGRNLVQMVGGGGVGRGPQTSHDFSFSPSSSSTARSSDAHLGWPPAPTGGRSSSASYGGVFGAEPMDCGSIEGVTTIAPRGRNGDQFRYSDDLPETSDWDYRGAPAATSIHQEFSAGNGAYEPQPRKGILKVTQPSSVVGGGNVNGFGGAPTARNSLPPGKSAGVRFADTVPNGDLSDENEPAGVDYANTDEVRPDDKELKKTGQELAKTVFAQIRKDMCVQSFTPFELDQSMAELTKVSGLVYFRLYGILQEVSPPLRQPPFKDYRVVSVRDVAKGTVLRGVCYEEFPSIEKLAQSGASEVFVRVFGRIAHDPQRVMLQIFSVRVATEVEKEEFLAQSFSAF